MMKRSILLLTFVSAGCSHHDDEYVLEPSLNVSYPCVVEAGDYQPAAGALYTIDERFADIARETPGGFGGFFRDGGSGKAYLVDLSKAEEARLVLSEEFGTASISFLRGRYDWLELISCYRTLQGGGVWETNVNATDIQESLNRIVLTVPDRDHDEPAVRELIRRLRIPQEMVLFEEGEMVQY